MVDQTVLIVGVASFQGFHLARRLLQEGFDVVGIDDEGRHKTRIAKQRLYVLTHPQFQLIRTTLANKTVMRSILKRHEPRHIILCSTRTVDDPLERYELMKRYIGLHTTRVPLESFITFDLPVKEVSEEDPASTYSRKTSSDLGMTPRHSCPKRLSRSTAASVFPVIMRRTSSTSPISMTSSSRSFGYCVWFKRDCRPSATFKFQPRTT